MNPFPVACDAGFSRSRGAGARMIMRTTESYFCHAFLRFLFSDGSTRIFESRIQTKGFREVSPASYDLAFLKESKIDSGLEAVVYVRLYPTCAYAPESLVLSDIIEDLRLNSALDLCQQWDGAKPYPLWQLVAIWAAHRYGMRVPQSDKKLICSEALAVIAFELGVDLRDKWHPNFDSVTPGSAWNNLMAIRAGYSSAIMRNEEAKVCGSGFSKYYSLRPRRS